VTVPSTTQRARTLRGGFFLLLATVSMLTAPISYHVLNVLFSVKLESLAWPVLLASLCLGLLFSGFAGVIRGGQRWLWAVIASLVGLVLLSVLSLLVLVLLGMALAFAGVPGYYLV